MNKQYYLLISNVDYKFDSSLSVITFSKQKVAVSYKKDLLKKESRKLQIDEHNNGAGNPSLYLVVNDEELIYTMDCILKSRNCRISQKLTDLYKAKSEQFTSSYTKSNYSKIKTFIDSIPKKSIKPTSKPKNKYEVVILYDENWNPIGCTKVLSDNLDNN